MEAYNISFDLSPSDILNEMMSREEENDGESKSPNKKPRVENPHFSSDVAFSPPLEETQPQTDQPPPHQPIRELSIVQQSPDTLQPQPHFTAADTLQQQQSILQHQQQSILQQPAIQELSPAMPPAPPPSKPFEMLPPDSTEDSMLLTMTQSTLSFTNLDTESYEKLYHIMLLSSFIKLYPEIISDLGISRTSLANYDDETRKKKFLQTRLYVLLNIEAESLKSFTTLFGLVTRIVIHTFFPSGLSKSADSVLHRAFENTERKTTSLFYLHAIDKLRDRKFQPPSLLSGYFSEVVKVLGTIFTEYIARQKLA